MPPFLSVNPGKLFYRNGYIFLNEMNRGVHIIDISKPSQPKVVAFVNIPGSVDLAVRSNILYADMYTDLVALDISDPLHTKVTSIAEGVFPQRQYVDFFADTNNVIVDWIRVDTTVRSTDEVSTWGLMGGCRLPGITRSGGFQFLIRWWNQWRRWQYGKVCFK